jgi:hypothetical protein
MPRRTSDVRGPQAEPDGQCLQTLIRDARNRHILVTQDILLGEKDQSRHRHMLPQKCGMFEGLGLCPGCKISPRRLPALRSFRPANLSEEFSLGIVLRISSWQLRNSSLQSHDQYDRFSEPIIKRSLDSSLRFGISNLGNKLQARWSKFECGGGCC